MLIDLTPYWDKIDTHAKEVAPTTCYGKRDGQTDVKKQILDSLVGKAAEFATYVYLQPLYPSLSEPDVAIYKGSKKSWKHDLSTDTFDISVKGQDIRQGKRYGISWVFEKTDKGLIETGRPVRFVFVTVDVEHKNADIKAILPLSALKFDLLKLDYLNRTKKAVYFEQMEGNLWQLP